jgi:hypothetical protein
MHVPSPKFKILSPNVWCLNIVITHTHTTFLRMWRSRSVVNRIMCGLAVSVCYVWMYGRPNCNTSIHIDGSTYAALYDYRESYIENFKVPKLRYCSPFLEPKSSLQYSSVPVAGPYPQPLAYCPLSWNLFAWDNFNIYYSPVGRFSSSFPTDFCSNLSSFLLVSTPRYFIRLRLVIIDQGCEKSGCHVVQMSELCSVVSSVCNWLPVILTATRVLRLFIDLWKICEPLSQTSPVWWGVESGAVFSILLLLSPSQLQTSSLVLCSQILSVCLRVCLQDRAREGSV